MKGVTEAMPRRARRHGDFLTRDAFIRYAGPLRVSLLVERQVGTLTRKARKDVIGGLMRRLCALGYYPPTIDDLKAKHVGALLRDAEDRKVSASTFTGYVTCLTVLCLAIGKPQFVDDVGGYLRDPEYVRRSGVAQYDKSLEGAGISFADVRARAMEVDERIACILELCYEFGMRVNEAWSCRPHQMLQGGVVCIYWGCKGGRKRQLSLVLTDEQRALVERAKAFAFTTAESMIPRGVRRKEWKSRWQRAMTRIGLTRKQLGRTPHALRHSFLCKDFETVSGHPAPVHGGNLHVIDSVADRAARELVANSAGHVRASIASAYVGGAKVSNDTHGDDSQSQS